MQYVSTIPCFTCTITNKSHTCHLVGVVTNFSCTLHSDSNTITNCPYLLHPKVGTYGEGRDGYKVSNYYQRCGCFSAFQDTFTVHEVQ